MAPATLYNAPSANPAPPIQISARRAYLQLLAIYAAGFGPACALSVTDFLLSCGALSATADARAAHWLTPAYIWAAAAGWCAALVLIHRDLAASAKDRNPALTIMPMRWSDGLRTGMRTGIRVAMLLSALIYAWAVRDARTLMHGELLWRAMLTVPTVTLTLLALDRLGVTPAQIGLRARRNAADAARARGAFAFSVLGLLGFWEASLLLIELVLHYAPHAKIAASSGVALPPFSLSGLVKMAAMGLSDALGEEVALCAALVVLMLGARQPRWRWLTLAAALCIGFHLYAGVSGIATGIFAITNAVIFARTARILPLITAYTLWPVLTAVLDHTTQSAFVNGVDVTAIWATLAVIALGVAVDHAVSAVRPISALRRLLPGLAHDR